VDPPPLVSLVDSHDSLAPGGYACALREAELLSGTASKAALDMQFPCREPNMGCHQTKITKCDYTTGTQNTEGIPNAETTGTPITEPSACTPNTEPDESPYEDEASTLGVDVGVGVDDLQIGMYDGSPYVRETIPLCATSHQEQGSPRLEAPDGHFHLFEIEENNHDQAGLSLCMDLGFDDLGDDIQLNVDLEADGLHLF